MCYVALYRTVCTCQRPCKDFGCIAHRTDFPESVRFPLPPLTGLISYYLGKKELNHKLYSMILDNASRGILWNTEMQEDIIEADRLVDESIMRSIKSMVIKEFHFKPPATIEQPGNVRWQSQRQPHL